MFCADFAQLRPLSRSLLGLWHGAGRGGFRIPSTRILLEIAAHVRLRRVRSIGSRLERRSGLGGLGGL
jgi:hypothetical protein